MLKILLHHFIHVFSSVFPTANIFISTLCVSCGDATRDIFILHNHPFLSVFSKKTNRIKGYKSRKHKNPSESRGTKIENTKCQPNQGVQKLENFVFLQSDTSIRVKILFFCNRRPRIGRKFCFSSIREVQQPKNIVFVQSEGFDSTKILF